ncbi:hypothetical protein RN001_004681 [Aquatica leii]|uniref:CREG-like beta-barrel domain-containing protein n=1 Tax=Aquatica leii TaxID=1421715 RepID=A0AAN7Q073_9COLE|nr:hypothetical protein RN001_004681 [Aquatica leii]
MYVCFMCALVSLVSYFISSTNGLSVIEVDPPQPCKDALMARYIIHNVGWVVISSISTMTQIKDYPYATVEEIVDGINDEGNGVPYFYVTIFDPLHINTLKNNRCTVIATLAQTDWCKRQNYEEEDPRCAKVMLSGKYVKVTNNTQEYKSALDNMHKKHPKTEHWSDVHHFYIAKMEIEYITLFDAFQSIKIVDIDDYFKSNGFNNKL